MNSRPPLENLYVYALMALLGLITADLGILSFRDHLIPNTPPPPKPAPMQRAGSVERSTYDKIVRRNIFNADGKIPDPIGADSKKMDGPPVPSNLPLALVGTIVHVNPAKSVCTITLRNKNDQESFSPGQAIKDNERDIATIEKVERNKVIFRNTVTGRLEFIEIKDDSKLSFGAPVRQQNGEVTKAGDFDYELSRDNVNKLTQNLPDLLQQARAVPEVGPDGRVIGFRVMDIQPGSIYERLGLSKGDLIKGVNGEPVDSPAKAMELYNALKTSSNIKLSIERNGRPEMINFTITN